MSEFFKCTNGCHREIQKLQRENTELKVYKEKWQEISGKANAIHCLKEVERLERENAELKKADHEWNKLLTDSEWLNDNLKRENNILKQAVKKLEKCNAVYSDSENDYWVDYTRPVNVNGKILYHMKDIKQLEKLARQTGEEVSELLRGIK